MNLEQLTVLDKQAFNNKLPKLEYRDRHFQVYSSQGIGMGTLLYIFLKGHSLCVPSN